MTAKPKLPLPLPHDVDVSDLPYMPMHDMRLVKSRAWLKAKHWRGGGPGLGFCLFNLWVAAFRSVPAGSLDDDDDMLADAARCDIDFWHGIKIDALRGWECHDGRLWHPVICDLAWDLWRSRLNARHLKTLESHRAKAKRDMDKGNEPSDPPGGFFEWMSVKFPATFAYQTALSYADNAPLSDVRTAYKQENTEDIRPKQSKGKDIPPIVPHSGDADTAQNGKEGGGGRSAADRKRWYALELTRLQNEFRHMLPMMRPYLASRDHGWQFGLVMVFKGCWLASGADGKPEIAATTKQRANAIVAEQGEWLRAHWPELRVRHAKVDELRTRKAGIGS